MSKNFNEKLRENPDSFDYMDSRPGPSQYPEANREAVTPPHVRELLAQRKSQKKGDKAVAAE